MALCATPFLERVYLAKSKAKGGKADPEDRLIGMMVGAPAIPICEYTATRVDEEVKLTLSFLQRYSSSVGLHPLSSCLEVVTGSDPSHLASPSVLAVSHILRRNYF